MGSILNGRWQTLRIVGIALSPEYVYEIRGTEIIPDNQRFGILWIQQEALATAFDMEGAFNDVSLTLMPGASEAEVIFQLDQQLETYGGLGAFGREDQISHTFISDEIRQLSAHAVFVPSIFLGIAAFLLNLLLSRLVSNQRDQIAVMKAFGYDNLTVGLHYLKLVMVVVLLGAMLGSGLGWWMGRGMTRLYADFYHFPLLQYEVRPQVVLTALLVSAGAATMGAFLAVRRAVALPPAEAMRPQAPPVYRAGWMERWGLRDHLSTSVRLALRNIGNRPLRSVFALAGVASAMTIILMGLYWGDTLRYIFYAQFTLIQREDATVTFENVVPERALRELERYPGVRQVEGYRNVGVRLHAGHKNKESSILGMPAGARLRVLRDQNLQAISLPARGLLLNISLAEQLNLQVGDRIEVEVLLESDRSRGAPRFGVRVAAIGEELLGGAAAMDLVLLR